MLAARTAALSLLAACATTPRYGELPGAGDGGDTEVDTGMIDASPDAPPAEDGAVRIETSEIIVEPYQDIIYCYVGTFRSDVDRLAIDYAAMYEDPTYGHHVQFNGIREGADGLDVPDGTLIDCTDGQAIMLATQQILSFNEVIGERGGGRMVLPEGTAVPVEPGSRWLIEVHVVNPTARRVRTHGVLDLRFVDPEAVQEWASAWTFNRSGFQLPPGEASTVEVDCAWPQEATVFALMGHMHERGTSMRVDAITPDGNRSMLYEVAEWEPIYRDAPLFTDLSGGQTFPAGTRFITTCNYFNDTSTTLRFPDEMCVSTGLFSPADAPVFCDQDTDEAGPGGQGEGPP